MDTPTSSKAEDINHAEHAVDGKDVVHVTPEDNKRIVRKIDLTILSILVWTYFLQILDKSTLGYAALFGMREAAGLVGSQYSSLGSMNAIAQLVWMPFSSYFIVRVPPRIFMPAIVFCWGASLCGMAAAKNYPSLVATRFLLGLFEAACLPLFAVITSVWWRRAEQPLRVCMWYGTNGVATMVGSAMSYGLGRIQSDVLDSYQIIFLVTGFMTVLTPIWIVWKLDNNVEDARFLSPIDRKKAALRVKANKTGSSANAASYQWSQAREACLELKTWLFFCMALLLNIGASVANVFGPLILSGLGFNRYTTSLLNIPFGAVQIIAIVAASYVAWRFQNKCYMLLALVVPVIVGLVLLYVLPVETSGSGPLILGYYLIGALFGANPLIISWISANTGGSTKKSVTLSSFNAASAAGNIIGPYLFKQVDAPRYLPGLRACLGIFVALFAVIILQVVNLTWLNRRKAAERVRKGLPAYPHDVSMDLKYRGDDADADVVVDGVERAPEVPDEDLTDKQNEMFVYVL